MLFRYAAFGAILAFAGPPIYIHVPKLYTDLHGIDVGTLGVILLLLRSVDFIQDPLLGYIIGRSDKSQRFVISIGLGALLAIGMLLLFIPSIPISVHLWLALSLVIVFTGFSGFQILYYSTGVGLARDDHSHEIVASWREAGILVGICAACVAPIMLSEYYGLGNGYFLYSVLFCVLLFIALWGLRYVWEIGYTTSINGTSFFSLLKDKILSRLFVIGFFNTLPVGITATLFLFYVEDRLEAPSHAGIMLLLFFLCAAVAAPFWGRVAQIFGIKQTMILGMLLSILAFSIAWGLGPGDYLIFYIVCAVSGAALGADMTLLPAMISKRLEYIGKGAEQTFGIWGFVNKSTLAIAAGVVLPALSFSGFVSNSENSNEALSALSFYYAALPCLLKLFAVFTLLVTTVEDEM